MDGRPSEIAAGSSSRSGNLVSVTNNKDGCSVEYPVPLSQPLILVAIVIGWLLCSSAYLRTMWKLAHEPDLHQFFTPTVVGGWLFISALALLPLVVVFGRPKTARIALSSSGLQFSDIWDPELQHKLVRNWSDLRSVRLAAVGTLSDVGVLKPMGDQSEDKRGYPMIIEWRKPGRLTKNPGSACLKIEFSSGGSATINLGYLRPEEVSVILQGLRRWTPRDSFAPEVVHLEQSIANNQADTTFTLPPSRS